MPHWAIYLFHGLFWSPYLLRGRLDRAQGRAPKEAVHRDPQAATLVGLHTLAMFVQYFGIGMGVFGTVRWTLFAGQVWVGAALIVAGWALSVWTLLVFRSWRLKAELDEHHELCTDGPFRHVRHPIYTAIVVLALGTFVWVPNLVTLLGVLANFAAGDLRARSEERLLGGAFGAEYAAFMARTKRFLPGVY